LEVGGKLDYHEKAFLRPRGVRQLAADDIFSMAA